MATERNPYDMKPEELGNVVPMASVEEEINATFEVDPTDGGVIVDLSGEENIREVIAFPKTQSGSDPLTNAPTPLNPTHLGELGLRLDPEAT